MDPNFCFSVRDGVINHLVDERYKDIRRQDYFIIRRYVKDLKNNFNLNMFCEHVYKYTKLKDSQLALSTINNECFDRSNVLYIRYNKHFPDIDKKFLSQLKVLWVFALTMYLTWRPHMIVDEFIVDPPTGRRRVLPRVVNYFDKPNGSLKFIQDNLKKLSIVVDTNMIPDNIYNFYGAPYCSLRIAQHESTLLHNRIFELEQKNLSLQKELDNVK